MPSLAMFPLGTTVLPGVPIPLHVFEPRYRALVRDCLGADQRFGSVLIERGSEVGGGDVRTSVGTSVGIVEAQELPDGRYALVGIGLSRLRVESWAADDPYPRAEVAEWPDPDTASAARIGELDRLLRRVLALRSELGAAGAPVTADLDPDPALAPFRIAALAGLGPLDVHGVLAAPSAGERCDLLTAQLTARVADLEGLLRG